ncbi:MAG: S-adenosylmethionine decarboxylase [Dehalococcoidia bacterium]
MHVIIDGYGGDPQRLADAAVLKALLDEYPAQMGMTKIAPPAVYRYVGAKPQDWGLSGFVLIAESHISVHTFPARGCLWADIFSCKDFDADAAVWNMATVFQLRAVFAGKIHRGLEYPPAIVNAQAMDRLERERVGAVIFTAPWADGETGS